MQRECTHCHAVFEAADRRRRWCDACRANTVEIEREYQRVREIGRRSVERKCMNCGAALPFRTPKKWCDGCLDRQQEIRADYHRRRWLEQRRVQRTCLDCGKELGKPLVQRCDGCREARRLMMGREKTRRRRGRMGGARVDYQAILERDGTLCYLCGEDAGAEMQFDHVVPLARGGTHDPENIRVACRRCNQRKWSHTLDELRQILSEKP